MDVEERGGGKHSLLMQKQVLLYLIAPIAARFLIAIDVGHNIVSCHNYAGAPRHADHVSLGFPWLRSALSTQSLSCLFCGG